MDEVIGIWILISYVMIQGIDPEVLKRRAERFGIPTKEAEEEKKRKRAERFGVPVSVILWVMKMSLF